MTLNEILQLLIVAADDVGRVFDYAEIRTWPPGTLDQFRRLRLLRPSSGGLMAPCPNCLDAHTETVTVFEESDGRRRYFIPCPESLRVEVTAEMCCGWQVDVEALASLIAVSIGLHGAKAMVPGRLWRLGRTKWKDGTRQVLFATRLIDDDASSVVCHVGTHGRDIVLVPHLIPERCLWPGLVPAVIPLTRVATLSSNGIELDLVAMVETVAEANRLAHTIGGLTLTDRELNSVVRRHVKAEKSASLTDEAIVAAYQAHGTVRQTAEALKAEGFKIHPATVARKVKQAQEAGELRETLDTPSVGRTVASQPRDRGKKMSQYGK
ncbi:MAG: hypothetical protein IT430_14185 [Phycisphaerales bacterium]|nr:hypothetical protein [Phycisphaerales bacterium]